MDAGVGQDDKLGGDEKHDEKRVWEKGCELSRRRMITLVVDDPISMDKVYIFEGVSYP
jgi:hypothetical protein